jgi:hypothetical protein
MTITRDCSPATPVLSETPRADARERAVGCRSRFYTAQRPEHSGRETCRGTTWSEWGIEMERDPELFFVAPVAPTAEVGILLEVGWWSTGRTRGQVFVAREILNFVGRDPAAPPSSAGSE